MQWMRPLDDYAAAVDEVPGGEGSFKYEKSEGVFVRLIGS